MGSVRQSIGITAVVAALALLPACDRSGMSGERGLRDPAPAAEDDSLSPVASCEDDREPNDDPRHACAIELGALLDARIEDGGEDEADCFRFDVEAGVAYTLSLAVTESTAGTADPSLHFDIESESGDTLLTRQQLTGRDDRPVIARAGYYVFIPDESTTAVLCLVAGDPGALYAYELRIDPDWRNGLEQVETTHEPNNSAPTAYPIELGAVVSSTIEQGGADHVDCFRFAVEAEVAYTLGIAVSETTAGRVDSRLLFAIETEDGETLLTQQGLTGPSGLPVIDRAGYYVFTPLDSTTAVLCLAAADKNGLFAYELRIDPDWRNGLQQAEATHEPNNSAPTAYPIEIGTLVTSTIEEGFEDHVDCFRFEVETEISYTLSLAVDESTAGTADPALAFEIESDAGATLLTLQGLAADQAGYYVLTPREAGTAILCLTANQQSALFAYRLRVDPDWSHGLVQEQATHEPNNSPPTAFPVEIGTSVASILEQGAEDHVDCFRFAVEGGVAYVLSLAVSESTAGPADPGLSFDVESDTGATLLTLRHLVADQADEYALAPVESGTAILCLTAAQASASFTYTFRID